MNWVITDGAHGAYVAWRRSVGQSDVYLQRVTAGGLILPPWPDTGLAIATTPYSDQLIDLSSDGSGGALIVWEDNTPGIPTGRDAKVQRIGPGATPASGWPTSGVRIEAPGTPYFSKIAAGNQERSFLVWEDDRDIVTTGNDDIYAISLLGDGTLAPGWPATGLPVAIGNWVAMIPRIIPDGQGGVYLAWIDEREHGEVAATYGSHLNADGSLASGWAANGTRLAPDVLGGLAPDGAGGVYVLSVNGNIQLGLKERYYLRRYGSDGTLSPGWPAQGVIVCDAPGFRDGEVIASDGQGGAYVSWYDSRGAEIYLLRILPNGAIAPGWSDDGTRISDPLNGSFESAPQLVSDGAGGVYATWELSSVNGVVVHHITENGQAAPGWPAYGLTTQPGLAPYITTDQEGGAIVAWHYQGVWAQRYVATGIVAVNLSLVSASAESDRVRLEWFAADAAGLAATVERREVDAAWRTLASVAADGTGHLRYEDREVTPGARYAYRLAYRDGGVDLHSDETTVEIPAAFELTLEGFRPNPAVGAPLVSFTLPRSGPGRLELFDLAGRRVASRDVTGLPAGRHSLRVETQVPLAPGAYLLRLTHGGSVLTRRGVVIP